MNFDRIAATIDVEAMQQSHVTSIGGAYGLLCDLVRSGLGAVALVDFDIISASNPARQDFYSTDLGQHKVEAAARYLKQINPDIEVECYVRDYCELSRDEHDRIFGDTDLFIYGTDFFPAQARGNLEALRAGKPAIWVGLYQGGRAGEIIYYVPGVTPACYRCICSSRYRAFAAGAANVTSTGATIHDLKLVDAIAGQVAVGIVTRGADNRMGRLIDQLGNRNLLQIKIDPDYRLAGKDIFAHYLGDDPANFSFTTIALPMEHDPDCPDCAHLYYRSGEGA
jgi:molybdopterin/thiamine biosynthesis adenylyltransferase